MLRAWHQPGNQRAPLRVTHEITHRCNLQCVFCGYWKNDPIGELSIEQIKGLMDRFVRLGTLSWGFTGGEPLIKPGVDKLIEHAVRKRLYANLVTNGTLLSEHLDAVRQLNFVIVSIDGPLALHDSLRGQGVFTRTLDGISRARDFGVPIVLQTILSGPLLREPEYRGLNSVLALAREHRCRIMFQKLYDDPFLPGQQNDALHCEPAELLRGLQFLQRCREREPRLFYQSATELIYMREDQLNHGPTCMAGLRFCMITPQGYLAPCIYKRNRAVSVKGEILDDLKSALKQLDRHHECHCSNSCYNRYNHLFHFNPATLWRTVCDLLHN